MSTVNSKTFLLGLSLLGLITVLVLVGWVLEIFSFFELIRNFRNFRNFWNFDFLFLDLLLDTNFSFKGFNKNCPASSWKGILGTLKCFTPSYISRQIKLRGNFRNFSNFYKNVQLHLEREF